MACPRSPLRVPQQPCCRTARSMPQTRDPTAARSEQSRSIRHPLGRTRKTPWDEVRGHAQISKLRERRERARHTPVEFVREEVAAHPKRTRPLGGTTPHPQQRCALPVPAALCSYGVPEVPSESTATALLPHCPLDALDMHSPLPRARSSADRSDTSSAARANAVGRRGYAQKCKICERREPARHTPCQRVLPEVAAHPERTRPLSGTTPHPQQRCALPVPAAPDLPARRGLL